ncbi:chaperone protein dnaJ 8, chloroplastic-like [Heracleum sosnowskyi]|uniref:Chaperone protein dnaJ 8, chloroplastic-like n=1 Tax=Heracleum sosnowskyi TaxID=360622 RepID=A0AAD8HBJ7_9APIA|nr:chaperone protein dnaJ 8, chloroplastic-like [Heracleum sosnowskyi]
MTSFGGVVSARGSSSLFQNMKKDLRNKRNHNKSRLFKISCVSTFSDPYKTLRINKGASEAEVKKAFRQLALQYHPDVCKGSNCGVQFHQINEAYDAVMASLSEKEEEVIPSWDNVPSADEAMRGMFDPDYDMWEEWMGWEGAGIRDYSSHINPYI